MDDKLLLKVALMYYEDGLTQAVIARRLGTSISTVSRMLVQARERQLVRIVLAHLPEEYHQLERALEKRYGLDEAVVVQPSDEAEPSLIRALGHAGVNYLKRVLSGGEVLGVSWGRTVLSVARSFEQPTRRLGVEVVPLVGGVGQREPEIHANNIAIELARRLGGKWLLLHAPVIVANSHIRDTLLQDEALAQVLEQARQADLALVGIGNAGTPSTLARMGYLRQEEMEALIARGAVGSMVISFFDQYGRPVPGVEERSIGVTLEELRRIPRVVALAGGREKVEAIRGALKGGLVNVLITDVATAQALTAAEEPVR